MATGISLLWMGEIEGEEKVGAERWEKGKLEEGGQKRGVLWEKL